MYVRRSEGISSVKDMNIELNKVTLKEKSNYFYVFNGEGKEKEVIRILDKKGFIKVQRNNGSVVKVKAKQYRGKEYAKKIREENGDVDIYELAEKLGIEVDYPQRPNGGGHIIFAQFVNPNKVTVFKDSVDKAIDLIEKENLNELFLNKNIEEILLAHEIFHYIEEHKGENLFAQTEKIRLWKFGPLKNDSNIVCLGEIAGMAFVKELLQMNYSPYILDSFLVYLYHPKVAYALYNEIMNITKA